MLTLPLLASRLLSAMLSLRLLRLCESSAAPGVNPLKCREISSAEGRAAQLSSTRLSGVNDDGICVIGRMGELVCGSV